MSFEYQHLLNPNFDPASRVWVYQSNRLFTMSEALEIEDLLQAFAREWKSHGSPVKGAAHLFFGQFIVLIADERATGVSGCSTDSSVRLMKEIEHRYGVSLFDRTTLAFIVNEKLELLPLSQFSYALERGFVSPGTLYFNNLVQTLEELKEKWIIPVSESWLAGKFQLSKGSH